MSQLPTNAQWFQPYGRCVCGKPAAGTLYNERNAKLGEYCKACADQALKASHKQGNFLPDAVRDRG